jgi:tRNA nucleotidyltransferase/poly(A) polymerase
MKNNAKFYLVGGAVRDKIIGIKSKDIDYAVECESFDAMRQAILDANGKIFLETPQYFTIRANVPTLGACDYVLCRKDGEYKDGRHPETVTAGTIYDDLARRDFTMNAIAYDIDNDKFIDPYDGINHIKCYLIKAVRSAKDRFNEDALRAFRAVRFAVQKNFVVDLDVQDAILNMREDDFRSVSADRVRDELMKMFSKDTRRSFKLIYDTYPVLGVIADGRGIWFKPTTEGK